MIELIEIKATRPISQHLWVNIIAYDGKFIEWFYQGFPTDNDKTQPIFKSMLKYEGPNKISGKAYFKNEVDKRDNNMHYLEDFSIIDYSLFDLVE